MRKLKCIISFCLISCFLLLVPTLQGQSKLTLSIKTHPVQWFYSYRPNINFELRLNERHALTADFMWKARIWRTRGGEIFPRLRKGKGYRISLGGRYYFPSSNPNEARDWFIELQMRYDRKEAQFVLDTQRSIAFFFGKQFNFGKSWGMDQYLGLNVYHWNSYYQENPKVDHRIYRPYAQKKQNISGIYYRPVWGGLLNFYVE